MLRTTPPLLNTFLKICSVENVHFLKNAAEEYKKLFF